MKKIILVIILTIALLGIFTYNKYLIDDKENMLKEFNKLNLLDVNGNVNLSEIETEKEILSKEVTNLLKEENMTTETFDEDMNKLKETNDELMNNLTNLSNKVSKLNVNKDNLISEYTVLNNEYEELKRQREEELRRNTIIISNVPTINQYPNYPTGCESVALTILLKYYGVNVTPDNVIASLKKGDKPYKENDVQYGGNPNIEFVGSPYQSDSYGVYNNPIVEVAQTYKPGAIVRTGMAFEEIIDLVNHGRPVIAWTSMNLALPYISDSWIYKPTGEKINWKAQEHAVVVIGYNDENIIISDPLTGTVRYQSRKTFESRYNYYGRMAVYY